MGWFGGRNDSVETIEDAQKIVTRTSSDLAKKKDTVKSLYARCRQITPLPRTVNGTGHTGPSEFCATSI